MADHKPDDDSGSIASLFSRLIDDAKTFVRAEIRLYRAEYLGRLGTAQSAIILFVVALLIANAAVIALILGLLLILRGPLGTGGATAVVVLVSLAIAGLLARVGIGKVRKVINPTEVPK